MATPLPPGIGTDDQAAQATAFMRSTPWYRQLFQSWGVNPDNPGAFHLNDDQQQQLLSTARANGIGISDRYEIDRNGAIVEGGHKLRNTLIGAGIGAGAIFGAPALAGLFAGGGGAGAAAGAGVGLGETAGGFGVGGLSASSLGGAAGGGGILGTAGKLIGFNAKNPSSYLDLAGKVGSTLGAASEGAAQGRIQQTLLNQGQDRLTQDRYRTQITAPQTIANNSVRGDILANVKDFAYGAPTMVGNIPVPTSTGGIRPSILSDNTRELGRRMSADALATGGPPDLTPMDEAGAGTSILNTAGTIGAFADLLNPDSYKSLIPSRRPALGRT